MLPLQSDAGFEQMVVRGYWPGELPSFDAPEYRVFHTDQSESVGSKHVDIAMLKHGDPQWQALYWRVETLMLEVNELFWNLELNSWMDHLRLNNYKESDHFGWHSDYTEYDNSKLSFNLCLKAADEGGELYFLDWEQDHMSLVQGEYVIFPSYCVHRVAPVVAGERLHLLGWLAGPRLR